MSNNTFKNFENINLENDTNMETEELSVPISQKLLLTIREAAAYSNIGRNKIEGLLKQRNCKFVFCVGVKRLVKRKEFEEFISQKLAI